MVPNYTTTRKLLSGMQSNSFGQFKSLFGSEHLLLNASRELNNSALLTKDRTDLHSRCSSSRGSVYLALDVALDSVGHVIC